MSPPNVFHSNTNSEQNRDNSHEPTHLSKTFLYWHVPIFYPMPSSLQQEFRFLHPAHVVMRRSKHKERPAAPVICRMSRRHAPGLPLHLAEL